MNKTKLKELIKKKNFSMNEISEKLGCDRGTLRRKINNDSFTVKDVKVLIDVLEIPSPYEIFFTDEAI